MSGPEGVTPEIVVEMVYAGRRMHKDKVVYTWAPLATIDDPSTHSTFSSKNIVSLPPRVGSVFAVTGSGSTVFVSGPRSPRFLRVLEGADTTLKVWAIKDEAAAEMQASKALATKAAKTTPLEEVRASVRQVAARLNDTERRAFLAILASEIMYA